MGDQPLFEWLVQLALERELGGATVSKGLAGFGRHHRLHHQHLMSLMDQLPAVVQMIDEPAKIDAYLDATGDALTGYTYIREKVRWHRPGR